MTKMNKENILRADERVVCEHASIIEDREGNFSGWIRNESGYKKVCDERDILLQENAELREKLKEAYARCGVSYE